MSRKSVRKGGKYRISPHKEIWISKVPSQVCFFISSLLLGRTLTTDNLQKRGMIVDGRCVMCSNSNENIDHLLRTCRFSADIWGYMFLNFAGSNCLQGQILDGLKNWKCQDLSVIGSRLWKRLMQGVCWSIWLKRNGRIFKGNARTVEKVIQSIKCHLWS